MSISKNQLKLLWTAKTKLDLSDAYLRSAMVEIAGVESTKELDAEGFDAMMGFFEYLGFAPRQAKGPDYGERPGMASFAQIELIRVLWREYTDRKGDEDSLNKWLEHYWHVSSLRFLGKAAARKVIATLKVMKARAA
ncbi:regulatory protein GemA [Primorskyibacter aestuariivivens]|uniref:regulatory protein GemA n=1 Tax=Primorskyibacter aestuariivivens TaxID=1888912 RepID=UPI002300F340|nr:regulatory protein GemA [Primorskyibacter aestuariivivens]MDA7427902.1 regulatory protein GemA [Primorskyibacter aestuariivivens]